MSKKKEIKGERIHVKKRSQAASILRRFLKNKPAILGTILFVTMVLLAVCAPLFADYEADAITMNMSERLMRPCSEHIFGTDSSGRDMFARIIYGGRISLFVGVASVSISLVAGLIIGSCAGYFGGKVDNILMRIMDVFLAIPSLLMSITIVAVLGPSMANLLLAMSLSSIPRFSRIVRSSILSIRGQDYIEAARACGTSNARIILRHVLPNAIGPIIVQASLNVATAVITVSSLSFIGLGISPPTPEWGSMLAEGREQMRYYPHLVLIPGLAIICTVMALNLIGDGLRDALDPKMKN